MAAAAAAAAAGQWVTTAMSITQDIWKMTAVAAASAAVQSAIIANQNCFVPSKNGIVGSSVEESIQNLGRVSDKGMTVTDEVIINVMDDMNKVK